MGVVLPATLLYVYAVPMYRGHFKFGTNKIYMMYLPGSAYSISYLPIHKVPFSDTSCTCKERVEASIFAHCNCHDMVTPRNEITCFHWQTAILLYLRGARPHNKLATLKAIIHLAIASMHYSLTACSSRAVQLQDTAFKANNSQPAGFGGPSKMTKFRIV